MKRFIPMVKKLLPRKFRREPHGVPGKKSKIGGSHNGIIMSMRIIPQIFPWAAEKRVINRKNFNLTLYNDGSRLYLFKEGGYMILTPAGVSILKSDPRAIKRYLKGETLHLTMSGNSTVKMFSANDYPTIIKEHRTGISAKTQMEHQRKIKTALAVSRSPHMAPEYYATASYKTATGLKEVSVMELLPGKKVMDIKEDLQSNPSAENMKQLHKLMDDYKAFKRWLQKVKLPVTDFHEGNVLAKYSPDLQRYIFGIIDQ